MAEQGRDGGGLSPWAAGAIVLGVLGVSAIAGRRNSPDESHPGIQRWYQRLDKPPFTPPKPVFGGVWPVLETLFGYGGYRLLRTERSPARSGAVALWLANSAMIGGWTELFFGRRLLGTSVIAAAGMAAGTAGYVAAAGPVDRKAALAGVPLALWLAFATVLSEEVWRRNKDDAR